MTTPYTFRPTVGKKLVSHYYSDLGQGLLDCLDEIHEHMRADKQA
jgi:UDP-glucose 4-epimerase